MLPVTAELLGACPDSARPPRIMTGAHPEAASTLGPAMLEWAASRADLQPKRWSGWRWWQQLVAARALEVDAAGALVWDTVVVTGPRQTGKSWLERALCSWRIHQAERFGEVQTLLHVAHKLDAAAEVWRPAAYWGTRQRSDYAVRFVNGAQCLERRADGSRWLIQAAREGAGVSYSLSMALVDEAWQVARPVVDAAISPALLETESPQLWLVSTAGDSTSDLMATNRALAIALSEAPDPGRTLILEWSAPPNADVDIDDPVTWRDASPYWDPRREARVAEKRTKLTDYEFRQQYLNQWVPTTKASLIDPARWQDIASRQGPEGPVSFGFDVAADRTHSAIVAAGEGRLEVVAAEPGVGWLEAEIRRLLERWEASVAIGDRHGPAITVIDALADLGDRVVAATTDELKIASGEMFDAVIDRSLTHRSHPALDGAVSMASKRASGGSWVFNRTAGGHVLVAAALALWHDRHGSPVADWLIL